VGRNAKCGFMFPINSLWAIPTWPIGIGGDNGASTTVRNVPDISLEAGAVGYSVYYSGSLVAFGGTSARAPLWAAAYTALVNEARANNSLSVLGFFGPILYQIGQAVDYTTLFHDITTGTNGLGSNAITCSANAAHKKDQPSNIVIKSGEYPAGTGYDLSTGLGFFKGDSLIAFLATIDTPPPPCVQGSGDKPCFRETTPKATTP
jgi:subtilase family serine protease